MGNVVAEITMSLDGFVAGPNDRVGRGLGDGGEVLHNWVMGGDWTYQGGAPFAATGIDKALLDESFRTAGSVVMGRRTFDFTQGWGDDPPFHMPCFVLTRRGQETLVKGDTSFTFVTDGVEKAVEQAKTAAGEHNVSVMGGARAIQECLRARLVDEIALHVAPVLLGAGKRLFDGLAPDLIKLKSTRIIESPFATHMRYRVLN